jgi:ADP-ribose pyrophosphatase
MEELFTGHGWRLTRSSAQLPDGTTEDLVRGKLCDTVHILAFPTPKTVLLLREFRPHWGHYVWMIPSGKMEEHLSIPENAQKELREETGFRSNKLRAFGTCNHREMIDSTCHLFIAEDLVRDPLPMDDTERIEVQELPVGEAIRRVLTSPITHTTSAYALLRYAREHGL